MGKLEPGSTRADGFSPFSWIELHSSNSHILLLPVWLPDLLLRAGTTWKSLKPFFPSTCNHWHDDSQQIIKGTAQTLGKGWESFNPWLCLQESPEAWELFGKENPKLILANQIGRKGSTFWLTPHFPWMWRKSPHIPFTASRKFLLARSMRDIWNPSSLTPGHIYLL